MKESHSKILALDIGGTLTKLAFLSDKEVKFAHFPNIKIPLNQNLAIYFYHFKSNFIEECIEFIKQHFKQYEYIALTGGGAFKYNSAFQGLGKKIIAVGQFESLLEGIESIRQFKIKEQFFSIKNHMKIEHNIEQKHFYPFIIVNVGSGVSILKLFRDQKQDKVKCERIGGTCLGGGFFLGLSQMLTQTNNFAELLQQANSGNNKNVDIVPSDYSQLEKQWPDLTNAPVLISLGKMEQYKKKEDITKSLFLMTAYNIAQMSLMHSRLQNVNRVVFTGFFCRNNTFMLDCFSEAFTFFEKQNLHKCSAYGLKHDGFLGALGALNVTMKKQNIRIFQQENS